MSLSYIYLTQAGNSIGVMTLPAVTGTLVKVSSSNKKILKLT